MSPIINYSPRRHTYFRMLYDWYTNDAVTGQPVHQMVDADLTMLKQSGFNLIHLYLWDRTLLQSENPAELAGFCPYPSSPSSCGQSSQWSALAEFVQKAETKGLYVALHFASGRFKADFEAGANTAPEFGTWANSFMQHLQPRKNILMWGFPWSVVPPPDTSTRAMAWRDAYRLMDDSARASSPNPRIMGLIGTLLAMPMSVGNPMISRGSQYVWTWQSAQVTVKAMRNLLTSSFNYTKDPDIYLMHLYHPNSFDLSASLNALVSAPYNPAVALNPDRNKIFINEFATGSPVKEPSIPSQELVKGNDVQIYGDENTPVLTPTGQSQWLSCALATFSGVGVQKLAYWALYDPYTMWTGVPWFQTGQALAWNGYWGLKYERETDGNKPAWSVLTGFYQSGSASCTAQPMTTFKIDNSFYTTGQPARLIWTAANTAIWEVSPLSGYSGTYDCREPIPSPGGPFTYLPNGSCAYTFSLAPSTPGSQTYTFTARAAGGTPFTSASASATILTAPLVTAVTNSFDQSSISQYDTIKVTGNAFSRWGGNSLQFIRSGFSDVWMYAADGTGSFQEPSYTQISAGLGGRLAPGQWQLYVRNGYASGPAGPISVTIN